MIHAVLCLGCLWAFAGCEDEPLGGPHHRVRAYGECSPPPNLVAVHDQLSGDGNGWRYHASVVMPFSALDAFVASCGFTQADFQQASRLADFASLEPRDENGAVPRFWQLPDPDAFSIAHEESRYLLIVERDTDIAAFVVASGH